MHIAVYKSCVPNKYKLLMNLEPSVQGAELRST